MRKLNSLLLLLILTIICPALAQAQLQRSEAFKGKYKLKEVVILSRHNIRSPLSTNGSALSKMTPHEWTNWSSAASELTLRGGVLETEMDSSSANGLSKRDCLRITMFQQLTK